MKPTTPRILPLIVFLGAIFCLGESYGQGSSAAFDPNCYFPKIGVLGEIDTIYGSHEGEYLGAGVINIGPAPDSTYGRISCLLSYPDSSSSSIFTTGPTFDLHRLKISGSLNIKNIIRLAHFRSSKYRDILSGDAGINYPARIYWQDGEGNYDSSRYTALWSSIRGNMNTNFEMMAPYSAHISSDSVEDIVYSAFAKDSGISQPKRYFIYFKGGEKLYSQGKIAFEDSSIFLDTVTMPFTTFPQKYSSEGDFRGVGRNDLLFADSYGNVLYYRNDPPFTMQSFLQELRFDTIFAQWQNPLSHYSVYTNSLSMRALSKEATDSSQDFLAFFDSDYLGKSIREIRIFRGGRDFGRNRWVADSASFVLHEPYYYDSKYSIDWGIAMRNCGQMTGTKDRMLYVGGSLDGGFYGYEFFYMLGDAIDDKVDMEIGPIPNGGGAGGQVDTLVADGDNMQDIIMGESGYGLNNGNEQNGSIYVLHGSNKIPDRTSSVSARRAVDESPSHILAYPNPCSGHTVLTFDNCSASKMKIQVVSMSGVEVLQDETPAVDGLQQYAVDLSAVPAGEYIVNLSCPVPGWSSSVKVIKQCAAVKPWTFDLKKMVGR